MRDFPGLQCQILTWMTEIFDLVLETNNRGDGECAGIPAVSKKLLYLGEVSQCHFDRAKPD